MGLKQGEPKNLGDITVRVTQVPVAKARSLLLVISKVVGPALGAALKGLDSKDGKVDLADIKVGALGDAIQVFFERVDEATLTKMDEMFRDTTELHKGDDRWVPLKAEYDIVFRGEMGLYFQWLAHCLEVNYSSFFSAFKGGGLPALQGLLTSRPSTSPSTSTGKSGESSEQGSAR